MLKKFPLIGGASRSGPRSGRIFSPFELLNVSEQATLDVLSSRGGRAKSLVHSLVGQPFADQFVDATTIQSTEAVLLQAILSSQVSSLLSDTELVNRSDPNVQKIAIFSKPVFMAELSRDGTDYVSRMFRPGSANWDHFKNEISTAFVRFCGDRAARVLNRNKDGKSFDASVSARFESLTAKHWNKLSGLAEDQLSERAELSALLASCIPHIHGAYYNANETQGAQSRRICSSQVRSQIRDWYLMLRDEHGLNRSQSINDGFEKRHPFDEPLNILPYVSIEPMDDRMSSVLVAVVTPFDSWFIDERVSSDLHLPNVTISVYDTSDLAGLRAVDLREAQNAMRVSISSLSHRLMSQNRGDTLALAAGEAANISRYWYSEGISELFGQDAMRGGLEKTDTTVFWERFVDRLLCATIEGLREVEVYPFDRAIIIQRAGSKPEGDGDDTLDVAILETGLLSKSPLDQGQILTSPARVNRDLGADFDLTRKSVVFRAKYQFSKATGLAGGLQISAVAMGVAEGQLSSNFDMQLGDKLTSSAADLSANSLLQAIVQSGEVHSTREPDDAVNQIRRRVGEETDGVLFAYESGLRIDEDAPLISQLMETHFNFMQMSEVGKSAFGKQSPRQFLDTLKNSDSKLVTFVFDPEMSEQNQRVGDSSNEKNYLDGTNAVTLILIGDEDIEKSVQDITAEREDLKLLLNMIVGQKIQDKRKEEGILRNRLQTIEAVLQGIFHKISALPIDPVEKKRIRLQWEGAKRLMSAEGDTQEELIVGTAADFLNIVAPDLAIETDAAPVDMANSLSRALSSHAQSLVAGFRAVSPDQDFRDVTIQVTPSPMARTKLAFPRAAIRECFDVLIKNAVEAAAVLPDHLPAQINISIETRPGPDDRHILDIRVDNAFDYLRAETWAALSSKVPVESGLNARKQQTTGHSTGIGVYAARQLLQMGYGSGADIFYESLGANWLRARMALPCQIEIPDLLQQDASYRPAPQEAPSGNYILYVEDDAGVQARGVAFLEEHFGEDSFKTTDHMRQAVEWIESDLPDFLLTDFSVLNEPGGTSSDGYGRAIVLNFLKAAAKLEKDRKCVILSGNDADRIVEKLNGGMPSGMTIAVVQVDGKEDITALDANVIIIKGLKDPAAYPALVDLMKARIEECTPVQDAPAETPAPLVTSDPTPRTATLIAPIQVKKLSDAIAKVAEQKGTESRFIDRTHQDHDAFLIEWLRHPGMVDEQLYNDDTIWPLWNADYNAHVVALTNIPEDRDTLAYRNWLISHKILSADVMPAFDYDFWRRFPNETGGFLSRLRHDVRNIRIDGGPKDIFARIEKGSADLEREIAFDTKKAVYEALTRNDKTLKKTISGLCEAAKKSETTRKKASFQKGLDTLQSELATLRGLVTQQDTRPDSTVTLIEESLKVFRVLLTKADQEAN